MTRKRECIVCAISDGILVRTEGVRRAGQAGIADPNVPIAADAKAVVERGVGRTDASAKA